MRAGLLTLALLAGLAGVPPDTAAAVTGGSAALRKRVVGLRRANARIQRSPRRADPRRGLRRLTGPRLRGQVLPAPPADPYVDVLPDGSVQILGSAQSAMVYRSLDDLLRGAPFRVVPFATDEGLVDGAAWDNVIHRWPGGREIMYGAVMTPTDGRETAAWPWDNWTRRVYAFERDARGVWVRNRTAIFNPVTAATKPTMLGHAYGHHFTTVRRGGVDETWLFHEEVVAENPLRTELFARRMLDPVTASPDKVKILGLDPVGAPAIGRRRSGEYLVEGPRPFSLELGGRRWSFVSFSSGDFDDANYDMHLAFRAGDPIGPHTPMLDGAGGLLGLGATIKQRYGLSWVGRAHVVTDPAGQHWAVFHALDRDGQRAHRRRGGFPDRDLFAVPLEFSLGQDGTPRVEVRDGELTRRR